MVIKRLVKTIDSEFIETVIERAQDSGKNKIRTSFLLSERPYEEFKAICKRKKIKPSRVINEFIKAFVEQKS